MSTDLTRFIVERLVARGIRIHNAEGRGKSFLVYCPMQKDPATGRVSVAADGHGHDDKTPSLSIFRDNGGFHCFGCGIKGRDWNVLAQLIGADQIPEDELPGPVEQLAERLKQMIESGLAPGPELPLHDGPWRGDFSRVDLDTGETITISAGLIKRLEGKSWYDDWKECYRILFPIYMHGEMVGWVSRRTDTEKDMKYRNMSGLPAREILYPFDLASSIVRDTVVIVEGPFDAIRLLNYGIPAVAMMGTENFTEQNASLIASIVDRVIIATDGGSAGLTCRNETVLPLMSTYCYVDHFFPPWGLDPGNMPGSEIIRLQQML